MMLFFRSLFALRHLRMHLAHEGLTARERYGYLMAWSIWITMASVTAVELTPPTVTVLYAIAVWGVWWAYKKNGGPDGQALLDRYFSVGFIVTLRVTVVLVVAMSALSVLQALGSQLLTASAYLQYFLSLAGPQEADGQAGADALHEMVMMGAELFVAWSIGREVGKIREAAGDAHALAPVASMTSLPQSAVSGGYGGWTGRTPAAPATPAVPVVPVVPSNARPLDRFVERVVQSELAARGNRRGGTKDRRAAGASSRTGQDDRRTAGTPRRRSAVRLIKARNTGRR